MLPYLLGVGLWTGLWASPARAQQRPVPVALTQSRVDTTDRPMDRSPDRWFAPDKAAHFMASATIHVAGYAALRTGHVPKAHATRTAAAAALLVGVGKELWDATGAGDPSWRDLAWDGLGVLAGVLLTRAADGPV
ncbi:MAG: hypothetical protein WCK74_02670 [Gemmatimonadaceae bacterium]